MVSDQTKKDPIPLAKQEWLANYGDKICEFGITSDATFVTAWSEARLIELSTSLTALQRYALAECMEKAFYVFLEKFLGGVQ